MYVYIYIYITHVPEVVHPTASQVPGVLWSETRSWSGLARSSAGSMRRRRLRWSPSAFSTWESSNLNRCFASDLEDSEHAVTIAIHSIDL